MNAVQTAETNLKEKRKAVDTFRESLKAQLEAGKPLDESQRSELKKLGDEANQAFAQFEDCKAIFATEENPDPFEKDRRFAKLSADADKGRPDFNEARRRGIKAVKSFKSYGSETAEERALKFGHFALAACFGDKAPRSQAYCKKHGMKMLWDAQDDGGSTKVMGESVNNLGGVLVPDEFMSDIIDLRETYGIFRQYADVRPMTRDVQTKSKRVSGVTTYYPDEGGTITASDVSLTRVSLTARKLAALAIFSSELDEDAVIDFGAWLADEIAFAFAYAEDLAGFLGDGTSTYGRIVGTTQRYRQLTEENGGTWGTNLEYAASLQKMTGNLFSEQVVGDFLKAIGLLPQYADGPNTRWFAHRYFYFAVMLQEALDSGGTTMSEVINGVRTPVYLGYPVVFAQVLPKADADNTVFAHFGDMARAVMLGDRRSITLAASSEYRFATDELAIRGTQRYDINFHSPGNYNSTAASREPGPLLGLVSIT